MAGTTATNAADINYDGANPVIRPGLNTVAVPDGPGRSLLTRLCRACDAAMGVEAAFVLPVLLLFVFGIVECGRAFWTQSSLQYAVTAAARCAAVSPSKCSNVPSYAASQAYGLSIPSSDFTYTAGTSCGNVGYTAGSQVTANYTFTSVVAGLLPQFASVPLTATACHP